MKVCGIHGRAADLADPASQIYDYAVALNSPFVTTSVCGDRLNKADYRDHEEECIGICRAAGEGAAKRGLRFTYHNHDLELKKYADGSCGLDNVFKNTDPANVGFELDVYWVKKGGQDPVEYIKKHGSRIWQLHMKDMAEDGSITELGNGNVYELPPGKKVDHVGVNRTPSAFADFVNQIITMIGSGLEIPYEVMTHRYNSNYTAARAAELDFRMVVRRFRKSFTDKFCQPIYEAWLAEAVALGRVECPGFFDDPLIRAAWCGCQWIGMSKGHVQPVQEANAARIRMESHITTGAQEAMEYNGGDYMENIAQYGRETAAIKAATPKEETSNG